MELGFRIILVGGSTRGTERQLRRPIFWISFHNLSLWIYEIAFAVHLGSSVSESELKRMELGFRIILVGGSTRGMEQKLRRPLFWIYFHNLSQWIYEILFASIRGRPEVNRS